MDLSTTLSLIGCFAVLSVVLQIPVLMALYKYRKQVKDLEKKLKELGETIPLLGIGATALGGVIGMGFKKFLNAQQASGTDHNPKEGSHE